MIEKIFSEFQFVPSLVEVIQNPISVYFIQFISFLFIASQLSIKISFMKINVFCVFFPAFSDNLIAKIYLVFLCFTSVNIPIILFNLVTAFP